jgi:hypothetical protein
MSGSPYSEALIHNVMLALGAQQIVDHVLLTPALKAEALRLREKQAHAVLEAAHDREALGRAALARVGDIRQETIRDVYDWLVRSGSSGTGKALLSEFEDRS